MSEFGDIVRKVMPKVRLVRSNLEGLYFLPIRYRYSAPAKAIQEIEVNWYPRPQRHGQETHELVVMIRSDNPSSLWFNADDCYIRTQDELKELNNVQS